VKKIRVSLGAILGDAQEQGLVARNVVSELRTNRRGKKRQAKKRQRRKLQAGVDFPNPDEIKTILAAAQGRWRPFFLVAVFTGLRSSELRGLRWADVDLKRSELHVRQRADRYQEIGLPKSEAGERTVPLPEQVRDELQEWKAKCPPGKNGKVYVFPNTEGGIEWHANIINRAWWPIQLTAGVAEVVKEGGKVVLDKDDQPVRKARYGGLHTLRHFFASWCLARKVDHGLEAPLKTVQEWLGHASITMTADVYGHMLPRGDDSAERKEAASQLLA
jgi:integrase